MMEVDDFADVAIQNPAEITTEALRQEEHAAPAGIQECPYWILTSRSFASTSRSRASTWS